MQPIERNAIRIDRLVEREGPLYPLAVLLPSLSPERVAAERSWLLPSFLDETSGLLTMSVHSYVIRTSRRTILVDGCVGNDKERAGFGSWHHQKTPYLARLGALGLRPPDIDIVFCTHLHPDHVGWNTRLADGRWVPTFPNASYLFGRVEWEQWRGFAEDEAAPTGPYPPAVCEVLRACYRDSVLPVVEAGLSRLVEDGHEIDKGITVQLAPGHTPGNAVVDIDVPGLRAVLSGDVVHHPLQVRFPEASSAFCFDAARSAATRRAFLEAASESRRLLLPAHFPAPTAGHIATRADEFYFSPFISDG